MSSWSCWIGPWAEHDYLQRCALSVDEHHVVAAARHAGCARMRVHVVAVGDETDGQQETDATRMPAAW